MLAVAWIAFDADVVAAQHLGDGPCCACPEERIKHHIAGVRGPDQHAVQQRFRLLRWMRFVAVFVFETLMPCADRQDPIRPHLNALVQSLQRLVVERVLCAFGLGRPDHRFMRVGEPFAAEVGHRVRFAPDHIIEDPVARVLQRRPDPKDVVIRADHPNSPVGFEQPARRLEPVLGKGVVGGERGKLVPFVINSINTGIVGAVQFALELKVIGRIGKDKIHAAFRQSVHGVNTIAINDRVQWKRRSALFFGHSYLPLSRRFVRLLVEVQDESKVIRCKVFN